MTKCLHVVYGAQRRVRIQEGLLPQPYVIEGLCPLSCSLLASYGPLLIKLQQSWIGLSINNFFAGCTLHVSHGWHPNSCDWWGSDCYLQCMELLTLMLLNRQNSCLPIVLSVGYLWCLQPSVLGIGIFLQLMRTSGRPEGLSSAIWQYIEAFQGDLSPLSSKTTIDTCNAYTSLAVRTGFCPICLV